MNYLTTKLGASPIIVEGTFPVSPHDAFDAWTNADELPQWFGAEANSMKRAEIDLKVGGCWRFIFEETDEKIVSLEGEYLEIVENERLIFSWRHVVEHSTDERTSTESSKVTVKFIKVNDGTKITLNHEDIKTEDGRLGVGKGWQGTFTSFHKIIATK